MRNIVLIDIDHTLAHASWRDNLRGDPWDDYYEAAKDDQPVEDMIQLVRLLHQSGAHMVGVTARPEKWRPSAFAWLLKYDVPLDMVLMRPNDDRRTSPLVKIDAVARAFGPTWPEQILCVIDDRDDVCSIFRSFGITTLLCSPRKDIE